MTDPYQKAVAMLARREHSRAELERKLARAHGPGSPEVGEALDRLEREGYLSDLRFARELARQRASQWGDARIGMELRRRGVPDHIVAAALDELADGEGARAAEALKGRLGGAGLPADPKERARHRRFLEGRGFGGEAIRQALKALAVAPEDDSS